MSYIVDKICTLTEEYVSTKLKNNLEDQYLQSWDSKAKNDSKFNYIYYAKKDGYNKSLYLNEIINIDQRKKNKKLTTLCNYCNNCVEDAEHFVLLCKKYEDVSTVLTS